MFEFAGEIVFLHLVNYWTVGGSFLQFAFSWNFVKVCFTYCGRQSIRFCVPLCVPSTVWFLLDLWSDCLLFTFISSTTHRIGLIFCYNMIETFGRRIFLFMYTLPWSSENLSTTGLITIILFWFCLISYDVFWVVKLYMFKLRKRVYIVQSHFLIPRCLCLRWILRFKMSLKTNIVKNS